MALTITNTNTVNLLNIVNRTSQNQNNVLTQLSTGLRINKGSDDPAGLIALKSLESELGAVDEALKNNQRTDAVLGVADKALGDISSLLQDVQGLVMASVSDGNISNSERAANQAQIDLAIESIDRIVRTTQFNGKRLLDGSGAIDTAVSSTDIENLKVFNRGNVENSATLAVTLSTAAAQAVTSVVAFGANNTSGATEMVITGTLGTATVSLGSGIAIGSAVSIINNATDLTGASAYASGTDLFLFSTTKGSQSFVSVDVISGGFVQGGAAMNEFANIKGVDATGTIAGSAFTADGSKVSFNVSGISGEFDVGSSFTTAEIHTITVQNTGGMTFQLGSSSDTRVTLGIDSLFAYKLGGAQTDTAGTVGYLNQLKSGGSYDLSTAAKRADALTIVKDSIDDVAIAQGRIGGFQKFQVKPAISSLNAAKIGLSDAKSVIGDTDYALATAELNKQSVLLNSGIQLLGLANQQASQILSLLGG